MDSVSFLFQKCILLYVSVIIRKLQCAIFFTICVDTPLKHYSLSKGSFHLAVNLIHGWNLKLQIKSQNKPLLTKSIFFLYYLYSRFYLQFHHNTRYHAYTGEHLFIGKVVITCLNQPLSCL